MKKKLWDLYAPIYERAMRSDKKIYQFMYDRIPEMIRDKKVLELATGPGLLAKNVAYAADSMIATDYSDGMIREAKKGYCPPNLTFDVCDAKDIPYEDDSFDAVIISNALHVMPEPEKALAEIDRVLKDDGILICPTFVEHKNGLGSRIWSGILSIAGVKFEHQWMGDDYLEWLESNGWEVTFSKMMSARISLMYVECVRNKDLDIKAESSMERVPKPVKTSKRYKAVSTLFRTIGVKKMLDKQGEEFDELLEEYRQKQKKPLKIPYKKMKDFSVETRLINGTICYVVKEKGGIPDKAVLYLFGGGYILPPDPGDIVLCGQIAENCNAEVWFPMYPMAPEHRLIETVQSTLGIYEEMLKSHDAEDIRFFGTSSGGGQCMSVCMYIKHEGLDVPLPGKLVLQSPGLQVPPSEKQKAEMAKLSDLDVMIPPGFFDTIAPVLATGDEAYLLSPILFDLTGFPPIDIFYGTNEVMIAYLDDFRETCSKCGAELNAHIGEGMMHCWGAMEFVPEARAVRQEYFKALK